MAGAPAGASPKIATPKGCVYEGGSVFVFSQFRYGPTFTGGILGHGKVHTHTPAPNKTRSQNASVLSTLYYNKSPLIPRLVRLLGPGLCYFTLPSMQSHNFDIMLLTQCYKLKMSSMSPKSIHRDEIYLKKNCTVVMAVLLTQCITNTKFI